jgi:hypothetical protein
VGCVPGDPLVATAIFDRLIRQGHVISIRGNRDRPRTERGAGPANLSGANPDTTTN